MLSVQFVIAGKIVVYHFVQVIFLHFNSNFFYQLLISRLCTKCCMAM